MKAFNSDAGCGYSQYVHVLEYLPNKYIILNSNNSEYRIGDEYFMEENEKKTYMTEINLEKTLNETPLKNSFLFKEFLDKYNKEKSISEEEIKLMEYLNSSVSYSSNEFGNNAFVIDKNKSLKDNLEKLFDIVIENTKDSVENRNLILY